MPAERSRNTIGQHRTWVLGRVLAGVYFLVIGIWLMSIGLLIALVFAIIDGIYALIFDRPLNLGRSWAFALFHHQLLIAKYSLGMTSWPGLLPRREHGRR